ncbi:MAG: hypothetical protein GY803_22085, partial [Chloroflexi bacterium]|nr:hypothetical protein [Chloroflexota bacterium]
MKKYLYLIIIVFLVACTGNGESGDMVEATAVPPTTAPAQTSGEDEAPTPMPEPTTAPAAEPTPEPEATAVEKPTDEDTGSQTQSTDPPASVSSDPGLACFGSADGVTCLTSDGAWQQLTRDNSTLGGNYIQAMTVCNDSGILMAHISGFTLYDGENFQEFPEGDEFSSADAIACDQKGGIWAAHFEGVSYYDGSSWTTYDSSHLGNESLVYDVKVGGDGTVWVATSGTVSSFDGSDWTVFETGSGLDDTYFFENLAFDRQGTLWASASDGLLVYGDGEWSLRENPGYLSPESLAADNDGNLWLGSLSDGIQIFDGGSWSTMDTSASDLSSNHIQALAVDGNGRVYAGTSYGLSIWDGGSWTTYRMDNADLISHNIRAAAVIDGGPTLPAPVPKANGSLVGSLTVDGAAYPDARVEICVES